MCQTCVTTKKCIHCEGHLTPYVVTMHAGLVSTLFKIRMAVRELGTYTIHVRNVMYDVKGECPYRLTYDEINNLTFLRLYGLVVHADEEHTRSGLWLFTARAGAFLDNEIDLPKTRYAFRGHVIPELDSAEHVSILNFQSKLPEFSRAFRDIPPRTSSAATTLKLFA